MMIVLLVGCSLVNLLLASFVGARRDGRAGQALVAVMLAATVWSLSYAAELGFSGALNELFGAFKYVGVGAMPIAWLIFTLYWSGRDDWVNSWVIIAMVIEPVLVLLLLAIPSTRDLVRFTDADGVVQSGPVFWGHLAYTMLIMVATAVGFVAMLARRSHSYRFEVFILAVAVLLPFMASIAFNLRIAPFDQFDYTPVAFTLSCAGLTWGLVQEHLIRLAPIAHSQVVEGMQDGVVVLDPDYHVVDANPAGIVALGWQTRRNWRGDPLPVPLATTVTRLGTSEVRIDSPSDSRMYEAQVSDLPHRAGHETGRLVVLRDISERRRMERQRATMLAEQARVAATLSRSLRPDRLPEVPGVSLGAEYRPAGGGEEIGGDFYDVYPIEDSWAFALGDVSGKGARSAAVTALARYTLRALTKPEDSPSQTVQTLNAQLLAETEDQEIYLTLVHGRMRRRGDDLEVTLCLGGHPKPFLVPADPDLPIRPVGEPGTAIGLLDLVETEDSTVLLRPGDALVSYTDGVSEARAGREFFGEEGLADVLEQLRDASAHTIAEGVLDAVLRYQDDVAADDIAVLVVQAPGLPTEPNLDLGIRPPRAAGEPAPGSTVTLGK
ncbi:MAG: histidine kinase N-terminal 7TM domain-containing protein [Actinomycetales bacterium]